MTNQPSVTVTQREMSRGDWQREGYKKIDTAMIHGVHRQERIDVRFSQDGTFAATFEDEMFQCTNFKVLIKAMSDRLKEREAFVFERYISISYQSRGESNRLRRGSRSWNGKNEHNPLAGFYLEFDVYDVSSPFKVAVYGDGPRGEAEQRVWRRLERENGEWKQVDKDETHSGKGRNADLQRLLPFTESRVETLLEIKRGIARLDAVLNSMFDEEVLASGEAAKMLDQLVVNRLLAPPEATQLALPAPKKAKKRS